MPIAQIFDNSPTDWTKQKPPGASTLNLALQKPEGSQPPGIDRVLTGAGESVAMPNINFKWFTNSRVLHTIPIKHLALFFDRFKNGLAYGGLPAPDALPGPGPYLEALIALLKSPDKLPQPLIQAIQVIENLSAPEHRRDLNAAVQQARADNAPLNPASSPECLALQIWLWVRFPEQILKAEVAPAVPDPQPIPTRPTIEQVSSLSSSDDERAGQAACPDETMPELSDEPGSDMPQRLLAPLELDTQPVATNAQPPTPLPPPTGPTAGEPPAALQSDVDGLVAPESDAGGPRSFNRHTGKIARLPAEVRDQINFMIYDGVPYARIIEQLGDAGKGLKPYHLTRWKKGGYQEWLKDQERRARIRAKDQLALDILREQDASKLREAPFQIAAGQIAELMADFDPATLKEKFQSDPLNFVRLLNALSKLSESSIKCESHRIEVAERQAQLQEKQVKPEDRCVTPETLQQINEILKLH